MGRPLRNNADYFPHDKNERNRDLIKALRRRFGLTGYAVYQMMREKLCGANHFTLEVSAQSLEVWAGDFEVEPAELEAMLDYMVEYKLLQQSGTALYCQDLIDSLQPLLQERQRKRESYTPQAGTAAVSDRKNAEKPRANPQSKGEESKEEEGGPEEVPAAPEPEAPKEPRNDFERVEAHFTKVYRDLYHVEPVFNFGQNRQLLRPLLKLNGLEAVNSVIDEAKTDKWIKEHHAFDLPTILSARLFNRLLRTALEKKRTATEDDWSTVEVFSIFPEAAHVNN